MTLSGRELLKKMLFRCIHAHRFNTIPEVQMVVMSEFYASLVAAWWIGFVKIDTIGSRYDQTK